MATGADVFTSARALLNDQSNKLYSDTKLLPFVKKAAAYLSQRAAQNEMQVSNSQSSIITVAAGVSSIVPLPTDMIYPISLFERAQGVTTPYQEVRELKVFPPDGVSGPTFDIWQWINQEVLVKVATRNNEVFIQYWSNLTLITSAASNVEAINSMDFLASKTAAFAAKYIGENYDRGRELDREAEEELRCIIGLGVKSWQDLPARRIPFGGYE